MVLHQQSRIAENNNAGSALQRDTSGQERVMALSASEIAERVGTFSHEELQAVTDFKPIYNGSADSVRYYSFSPVETSFTIDSSGGFRGQASVQVVRDVEYNGKTLTGSDRFNAEVVGKTIDGSVKIERVTLSLRHPAFA